MKYIAILITILCLAGAVMGQARTAEQIVSVPFSQLNTGNPPNGSVRHVINGSQGTTPCASGGQGALAMKINGVWQCPRLTAGVGTGDVAGPSASAIGEMAVYADTTGKNIGRSSGLDGIAFLTSGVVTALASSGTGSVVRSNTATLNSPTLLTPTIASFINAQHLHTSANAGGQLNASNVFSAGIVPPVRIISNALTPNKCLRLSSGGAIETAADDCGTGGGGGSPPGGVSGNLQFNDAGVHGGILNSAYNSATGRLTFNQKQDAADTFYGTRFTDTSPTGYWLRLRNAVDTTDLFSVAASGEVYWSTSALAKNVAAPATPAAGNTRIWTDSTDKNLKAQDDTGQVTITLRATACTGTDKVSGINSAGVVTCAADQGAAGTGVISLNTLVADTQTFSKVDDTNVTLTISTTSSSNHQFAMGWTGTLAKARQNAATVYNDAGNTWSTGTQSFAGATSLTVPTAAGAAPTADGQIAYDSTADTWEVGQNGTNRLVALTTGSQTFTDKTLDNSTTANLRDTLLTLQDNTDSTKTANFELSSITSGQNRVVTIPDAASVTVRPTTVTSNQWVTHIDSTGTQQKAQPSFANISGTMGETQGGTGQTAYAQGDMLFASSANTLSRLAKSTTATRYLANTGASNNPQWDLVNLANGVTGTLADGNLSANVSLLGTSIDLSGAEATGILAAARFPALTGDVTTTSGAVATTIANDVVSNAKLANMATATFKGRTTAGTGDPEDLTGTQATALLNNATITLKGLVPAPGSSTGLFLRDDITWAAPAGSGDMILAASQVVTGRKEFNPAKLVIGDTASAPTPELGALYVDTDDSKLYYGINGTDWGEILVSGLGTVNLASANVSGILPLANGGTGAALADPGADRILFWDDSAGTAEWLTLGTNLSITGTTINASGGGGTPGGADTNVQINDGGAFFGEAAFSYNKTTNLLTVEALATSGSGAGYIELAEGSAPTVVANHITLVAPVDVPAAGLLYVLPSDTPTNGEQLTANISGTTVTLSWDAAGSGGSGDAVSVNGSAATDANFVATTASGTVPSVTWAIDTGATPDAISIATIGAASATEAGVVTTGTQTFAGVKTLATPTITGAITFDDNVRQTFNPGTNAAGINVGSIAGDPDTPSNGDLWYDSTANELTARINGANVALGAGGGGGANTALSNLAAVAINTSLISDTNNTDDLGSSGIRWKDVYAMSLDLGGSGAGYLELAEGTAPSLVANRVQHVAAADAPAGGSAYIWGAAAGSGILRVANSSGTMTVTQDAGVSHLASSTSADLRGVLSDENGTGAALFVGGDIGAGAATTPSANDNDTSIATTAYVQTELTAYASDTATFTNKTYDTEGTGNAFTSTVKAFMPAAGCQNTTAASFWDLPTATPAVAACVTGTVVQKGVLDFADTSGGFSAQNTLQLPADFTGTVDAKLLWTTTATSGNVEWSVSTICTATDATELDDPGAFNTASTVVTAAPGVASRVQTSSITSLTITGCAANELLHVRVFRDGNDAQDTLSATVRLVGVELTIRRAQ